MVFITSMLIKYSEASVGTMAHQHPTVCGPRLIGRDPELLPSEGVDGYKALLSSPTRSFPLTQRHMGVLRAPRPLLTALRQGPAVLSCPCRRRERWPRERKG